MEIIESADRVEIDVLEVGAKIGRPNPEILLKRENSFIAEYFIVDCSSEGSRLPGSACVLIIRPSNFQLVFLLVEYLIAKFGLSSLEVFLAHLIESAHVGHDLVVSERFQKQPWNFELLSRGHLLIADILLFPYELGEYLLPKVLIFSSYALFSRH